jgi:hypothetical protein
VRIARAASSQPSPSVADSSAVTAKSDRLRETVTNA